MEVRDAVQGPAELAERVRAAGVQILTGHVVAEAKGGRTASSASASFPSAPDGAPEVEIACDTLCQAVGSAPMVELLDVLGARIVFDEAAGGYVPAARTAARRPCPMVSVGGRLRGREREATPPIAATGWRRCWRRGTRRSITCQCEEVTRAALLGVKHPAYLGPIPPRHGGARPRAAWPRTAR